MQKFIPLSVPNLKGNELQYVTDAIETEWVSTGGSYINDFEKEMAKYLQINYAVACQSGTAALHLSLIALGVGIDDEVIVPTLTFIAAVNPVRYVGATPVFMDCDDTLCMDVEKLECFCATECTLENGVLINSTSKKAIKAVIMVHVFGNMPDMEQLMSVAKKYNLKVIEDATEALGTHYITGKYKGQFAGTIGHAGALSFNGNKIITTGGGGMVISQDDEILQKIKHLSTQAKSDELHYRHDEIGYNYRMTNVQAAIGLAQLEQLEAFIKTKADNYAKYQETLKNQAFTILDFAKNIRSNHWFYSLVIQDKGINRNELIDALQKKGIQTRPIWGLIHEQPPYRDCQAFAIETAKWYYERVVNIPCSTNLTKEDVDIVVGVLNEMTK